MNFRIALLASVLLAASAMAQPEQVCTNLCCKKVLPTKNGNVGLQCARFLPGSGAPSFAPEPSCPDQPLCCKRVAPSGKIGTQCNRIYF